MVKKGYKQTIEHKNRIAIAHKGQKHSKKTKTQISTSCKGRKLSKETKKKISLTAKIKRMKNPIKCKSCNKIFYVILSRFKHAKYCSQKCSNKQLKNKSFDEYYGLKKSKKIRQLMSKNCAWRKNKGKKNIEIYGVKKAKEIKEKLRKHSIWNKNILYDTYFGLEKAKEIKEKISNSLKNSESAKNARKNIITPLKDTKIEVKIQNFLKQLRLKFIKHKYIKEIKHSYPCDIFIPSMNLIIECDGDFFHMNPNNFLPDDKNFKNGKTAKEIWARDRIRTNELLYAGFKVLRLWECDINNITIEEFNTKLNV